MNVAEICTNVMSGSVGKIVRDLYDGIRTKGDSCKIFYGRGKIPVGYDAIRIDNKFEVYVNVISARIFDNDGLFAIFATKKLIKELEKYNPDVVHIHCLHGYYINYPMLFRYLRDKNKKVIWTMHDCWAYTGHCTYNTFSKCDKWKTECKRCPQKKAYPKSVIFDNSHLNFKMKMKYFSILNDEQMCIISPSNWLAEEIRKTFLRKYSIKTIHNGITRNFCNDKNSYRQKDKIILGVANIWDKRKGLDDFKELALVIPKDYRIIIVGANEKQIQELKEYRNITAIKRTSSVEELISLYRSATVLFNPTYEDNYPTVNIEAIACGLPVVTYQTGGSPELIEECNSGIVINHKDYDSLISFVCSKPEVCLNDSLIKSLYSEYMVEQYIQLMHEGY